MDKFRLIDEINFKNKKALIRVDFNVPLNSRFEITDDTRIKESIKTILHIIENGGKCIIISHLGRPKGEGYEKKYSFNNILEALSKELKKDLLFISDYFEENFSINNAVKNHNIILLENLRFHKQEKLNEKLFSKKLASFADVYVNDAFGTCHRKHASTFSVAKYSKEKCIGKLIEKELDNINYLLSKKENPFSAIIGGAKVSDKIGIIYKLIELVDNIIIGGAMANTFIASLGGNIGDSLFEKEKLIISKNLLNKAKKNNVKVFLPEDVICSSKLENIDDIKLYDAYKIKNGHSCFDIGPKTIIKFEKIIINSKKIVWNGPMGVFENDNFSNGTDKIAQAISNATKNGAFSLIGGGDSVASIKKNSMKDNISHISTGGGALLEYISKGSLPSLDLLKKE